MPEGPAVHFCAPIAAASTFQLTISTGSPPIEVIPSRMNEVSYLLHISAIAAASWVIPELVSL